jgi:hypothetical protein
MSTSESIIRIILAPVEHQMFQRVRTPVVIVAFRMHSKITMHSGRDDVGQTDVESRTFVFYELHRDVLVGERENRFIFSVPSHHGRRFVRRFVCWRFNK